MKQGAVFINTARGALVEEALYRVGMACVEGIKKMLYVSDKV